VTARAAGPVVVSVALAILAGCSAAPRKGAVYWCDQGVATVAPGAAAPASSCAPVLDWADAPLCGNSVPRADVLVLDLEKPDEAQRFERELADRFRPVSDGWIAFGAAGSGVDTANRARNAAAGRGCAMVLMGPLLTYDTLSGGVRQSPRTKRYRLLRLGTAAESP